MKTKIFTPKIRCHEVGSENGGGDVTSGQGNMFAVDMNETYTVERNQELINTGVFYLDGEMVLDGKWALVADEIHRPDGGIGGVIGDIGHTHTNLLDLGVLNLIQYTVGDFRQNIDHSLNMFPVFKILDENGVELHPVIQHESLGRACIKSNIPLTGRVYALHEPHSDELSELTDISLSNINGTFTQTIAHSSGTFPIFKFLSSDGTELDFKVTHLDVNNVKIESNIMVTGKIYML